MREYRVTTKSGSVYNFAESGGIWTVYPENVPNRRFSALPRRSYAIERPFPFPFVKGRGIIVQPSNTVLLNDEDYLPGGSFITSRVVDVREV